MLKLSIALIALLSGSSVQVSSSPLFAGGGNLFAPLGFATGSPLNPFGIINGVNAQLSNMFNNPAGGSNLRFVGAGSAASAGGGLLGHGGFVGGGTAVSSGGGLLGNGGFVGGGTAVSSGGGLFGHGGFVGGGGSVVSSSGPGGFVGGSTTFSGGSLGQGGVTTSTTSLFTNTGERYLQETSEWYDGNFLRRNVRTIWPSKGTSELRRYRIDLRKPNAKAVEISD